MLTLNNPPSLNYLSKNDEATFFTFSMLRNSISFRLAFIRKTFTGVLLKRVLTISYFMRKFQSCTFVTITSFQRWYQYPYCQTRIFFMIANKCVEVFTVCNKYTIHHSNRQLNDYQLSKKHHHQIHPLTSETKHSGEKLS